MKSSHRDIRFKVDVYFTKFYCQKLSQEHMTKSILEPANMPIEEEFLKIDKSKERVTAHLRIFDVLDDEHVVSFIPSLNLSGYGNSIQESRDMIQYVLDDYFEALLKLKKSTIARELSNFGWSQHYFSKQFKNKSFVDKDGILKNFELPEDTQIQESMLRLNPA